MSRRDDGSRPGRAMVMNFYHPWVFGSAERFTQIIRSELRRGRSLVYVYASDSGVEQELHRGLCDDEYKSLALYKLATPSSVRPVSSLACTLSGARPVAIDQLVRDCSVSYVRSYHPAECFLPFLEGAGESLPFVYDVMDLWDDFEDIPWGDASTESRYVTRADALLAVSHLLLDRLPVDCNKHLSPNAVDSVFLERVRAAIAPNVGGSRARKRVLCMGTLWGNWFDWELAERLTHELADNDFLFIGSMRPPDDMRGASDVYERLACLAERPNVRVVDEVPHDDLIPYLVWGDVAIIPFRPSPLTVAISPLRVYEHLAARSVVVSAGIPDIAHFPAVRTADVADDFVWNVRQADRDRLSAAELQEIDAFVSTNTWDARLDQLDAIVERLA